MIVLAFRTKLLLAMMAVVVGVTGATIYATQERVRRTYESVFQDQVEEQIWFFTELQETRLRGIRQKCMDLNRSVRLRAALEEGDAEVLYDRNNALAELRDILVAPGAEVRTAGVPAAARATFLAFLDASGRILQPPAAEADLLPPVVARQLERQVPALRQALAGASGAQQTGYLSLGQTEGGALHEVIFTQMATPEGDHVFGGMILGFPLPSVADRAPNNPSQIRTDIWMDGRLHSNGLPGGLRQAVAPELATRVRSGVGEGSFEVGTGSSQTRVFFHRLNPESHFPPAYRICLYSLQKMREEQEQLLALMVAFGGVALVGALALSLILSHGLAVPIHALLKATNAIREGDYTVKVQVRSRDEIGRLGDSFNEMAAGLVERERFRSLLQVVSDPAIAEQLISEGVELGGETREVSVIFCDIRGFTALSQGMSPAEVISMLNEHFTPLTRIVREHHGAVDKFVGDLIMALFGAPKSHGNDAAQAARCARRMIEERAVLNQSSQYRIEVGIGVATGPVVAGCMGSADRLNYTVLGERVNLASRLCSKAGRMEVVIDQTTRDRLGATAVVEPLGDIELKGFSSRVPAYKLVAFQEPTSNS